MSFKECNNSCIDTNLDASYPLLMRLGLIPPKIIFSLVASGLLSEAAARELIPLPGFLPSLITKAITGRWTAHYDKAWMAGIPLFLLGAFIANSAKNQFKEADFKMMSAKQKGVMKTGWFARTRNPMYVGFVLALTGLSVACPTYFNAFLPGLFFSLISLDYIPWEEKTMEKEFGDEYRKYRAATPKWFLF